MDEHFAYTTPEDAGRAQAEQYATKRRVVPKTDAARWISEHEGSYRELVRDCEFAKRRGERVTLGLFISCVRREGIAYADGPRRDREGVVQLAQGLRAVVAFERPDLRTTIGI